jgi:hypothetical protein
MLEKKIRKTLIEIKEQKEKQVIQEQIVKNRISIILEDVKCEEDFKKLSNQKQLKISVNLINELGYLQDNGLLLEEVLLDSLKSLFGPTIFSSFTQTFFEPILNRILSKIGFGDGVFKNFLVSALTSSPSEFIHAFKDCKSMTQLLVRSFIEAEVMFLQKEAGFDGYVLNFVRNSLGDMSRNNEFSSNMEKAFSGTVCELLDKFSNNTKKAVTRLKDNQTTNTNDLVDTAKRYLNKVTT